MDDWIGALSIIIIALGAVALVGAVAMALIDFLEDWWENR